MKFSLISIRESEGTLLAHTVRQDGWTLKKGHRITSADIEKLSAAGILEIYAAALESGDVHEDEAAALIAKQSAGAGTETTRAFTGRCNIVAKQSGITRVDSDWINRFNNIDEAVTIATLSDYARAAEGQVVATVKVIPFAVAADAMARVENVLQTAAEPVYVLPLQSFSAALINTVLPSLKASVVAKTTELSRRRIKSVHGTLDNVTECEHDPESIAHAVEEAVSKKPDLIVIVGASVTVDRADAVPEGIGRAGGAIEHFGMPVDPGNMMVLARHDKTPIFVLPGCARSPKLNGIDWVLERFSARIPVSGRDIMGMGVGGLLVDSPSRPLPRDKAVKEVEEETQAVLNVAGVVLAAGQSRRMGEINKLLERIDGMPLVRRSVQAVIDAGVTPVVVVTGYDSDAVTETLRGLDVETVHNENFADGLSTSLRAGLEALPEESDAVVVCLADMPAVAPSHIKELVNRFDPEMDRLIGVPVHRGKRGNPILWARRFWPGMSDVRGDVGARHLIGENADLVYEVEFDDTSILTDLDTPEQLARYRESEGG
jgi:molybdenum cofactor cytidylyltransferase